MISAINICKEKDSKMNLMVERSRTMLVGKMLQERNIVYEVTVQECFATPSGIIHRRPRSPMLSAGRQRRYQINAVMDWKEFHPLETIYKFLDAMEVQYPSLCTVINIGRSVEGRDIKVLKISNSDAKNTGVWLDGTIHAREWISTAVVTYLANEIASTFNTLGQYVTNKDWYFLPVVNPDGYHHSFAVDRMWRKSRAVHGHTIVGVDLNRNFSFRWANNGLDVSSDPNHRNYRGTAPFSEPECSAIKDIILYSGTPFKIFLSFHAYSEVISFPWCYMADPCPDYVTLLEGGTCMAKAIYETNGRMYKVGNFKDVMYYACGTSIDWSYGTAHIPFSYLVELRSKKDKFLLPPGEIIDCCKEVFNGVLALASFVEDKKCFNCSVFEKKNSI